MMLIGVNRSPFTRRVAITLQAYGIPYEQLPISGFNDRSEVRASNPLGRIRRWCSMMATCWSIAVLSSTISMRQSVATAH